MTASIDPLIERRQEMAVRRRVVLAVECGKLLGRPLNEK